VIAPPPPGLSATTEKEKGVAGIKAKEIKSLSLLFLSRLSLLINKAKALTFFASLSFISRVPLFREKCHPLLVHSTRM
jgi:hypothetical protein